MTQPLRLDPNRLLPSDPATRLLASQLYENVAHLPIVSPHGHTDPAWFATNEPFGNASDLLLRPDHYLLRMLYSQGISLEALGVGAEADPRESWRLFAANYHLFRGTPSRLWLDWAFAEVFGLDQRLGEDTSDLYFDRIGELLGGASLRPRALVDRFRIEVIATTDSPLDALEHHRAIRAANASEEWSGRIIPTYRPDAVVDPSAGNFLPNLERFSQITGQDCFSWTGYLAAHRKRRATFIDMGATATDHGHPTSATANLSAAEAAALFARVTSGAASAEDDELFRAQMLTEMARMSLDDGLVMQIHPGAWRNHNQWLFDRFGADRGGDIPVQTGFTRELKPLLDLFGNEARLTIILFTLDESAYSRELAPLAGHYPPLKIGAPWWFHDSPEGLGRFRRRVTETAGFYNGAGFVDDTRALLSIPARHDVARRIDCSFLAGLVVGHRIEDWEAFELAPELAAGLARRTYRL